MKNIFVGNLSRDATEHTLRSLFEEYGTVNEARVVTDRDTGRTTGFGFVEMTVGVEADRAIEELNGLQVRGRALNVNEAWPREERAGFADGPRSHSHGNKRSRNHY